MTELVGDAVAPVRELPFAPWAGEEAGEEAGVEALFEAGEEDLEEEVILMEDEAV